MRPLPSLVTSITVPVSATSAVRAGEPEPGGEETLTQRRAHAAHHRRDVVRVKRRAERAREQLGHLPSTLVNGGHHEVAGVVTGELQQPLAEVRLHGLDPRGGKRRVEADLLGDHRLALHRQRDAAAATKFDDVGVGVRRAAHLHDDGASGLGMLADCATYRAGSASTRSLIAVNSPRRRRNRNR